jgi:hypothetical protein
MRKKSDDSTPNSKRRRTSHQNQSLLRVRIDDAPLCEALQLSSASSTRDVLEQNLQLLVRLKHQEQLRGARGPLRWSSDLAVMRRD